MSEGTFLSLQPILMHRFIIPVLELQDDNIPTITKTCLFKNIENLTAKNRKQNQIKTDIFHISAQKIECGYSLEPPRLYSLEPPHRGGSNEYPQSLFLSRNKKNSVYPCKPMFYYIKVGYKGGKIT